MWMHLNLRANLHATSVVCIMRCALCDIRCACVLGQIYLRVDPEEAATIQRRAQAFPSLLEGVFTSTADLISHLQATMPWIICVLVHGVHLFVCWVSGFCAMCADAVYVDLCAHV